MGVIVALLVNYFLPRERVVACWEKVKGLFRPLSTPDGTPRAAAVFLQNSKRLLYSEILCGSLFSGLLPVCYSGLLLAGEML